MSSERLSPLFTWRSALCESGLPATTRHVGLTLSLHMSERGDSAFPSVSTLAEETGLVRRTVQRKMRELEEEGWIEPDGWASYQTAGGEQKTRRYRATVPNEQGGVRDAPPSARAREQEAPPGGDRETPPGGKGASEDREGGVTVPPKDVKEDVSKNTTTEVGDSSSDDSSSPEGEEESTRTGKPGPDDQRLRNWIHDTPASENAPTAHWVDGVRALWWGQDEDPVGQGVGATMNYLATSVARHGASHMDGARFIVGCHLLRERGELMGLDPGEPFGRGLLLEHDKGEGRLIWGRALDGALELESPDDEETQRVLGQVGLNLDGAEKEVDRVPA